MPENRSRFVLLCQQVLAMAVVAAMAAPAANLVSLDIVAPPHPSARSATGVPGDPAADAGPETPAGSARSLVASAPVRPTVTDVPLGGVSKAGVAVLPASEVTVPPGSADAARLVATEGDPEVDDLTVLTAPVKVSGLATVGVTWKHSDQVADDAIRVWVRTQDASRAWSGWQKVPYHSEEGPDESSAEEADDRPGTDPVYVGHVAAVQVKAVTATGTAPDGMRLSLVDPGAETEPTRQEPAIDTGSLDLSAAEGPLVPGADPNPTDETADATDGNERSTTDGTDAAAALASGASVTRKPTIFSRAQWGADERMRDKGSLHYGKVNAGFVHHTVNANNYTAAQVPAILRGIYAYHTQSRGWSDIGYNYLVDRFGRIWEGRYGGVARPVVGAHTSGYNDESFAMSAIGNYEVAKPPAAVLDAYGRLFAWKLSLHGISASATHQWVAKRYLHAINGHRDVGQTACPGKYLYAKIPTIRTLAAKYQKSWSGRSRATNLAGSSWPDLVVRDRRTKQGYELRTGGGQLGFASTTVARTGLGGSDLMTVVGDVTGDHRADLLARTRKTGTTSVYPGDGAGHFGAPVHPSPRFAKVDALTAVGDWNGDGKLDVVGRIGTTKRLYVYYGNGKGAFGATHRRLSSDASRYESLSGAGDLTGDHHPDLAARTTDGRLVLLPWSKGGLGAPRVLATGLGGYRLLNGAGDVTGDGKPDLLLRSLRSKATTWVYPGDGRGGLAARVGPYSTFSGVNAIVSAGQLRGSSAGDVIGRDSSGRVLTFVNNGKRPVEALVPIGRTFPRADLLLSVGDWNGDGHGDIMSRSSSGAMYLLRGNGRGSFADPVRAGSGFGSVGMLTAVGDMTGDGYPDLMGQPRGGSMRIYPSNHGTGFSASYVAHAAITGVQQLGLGLWTGDGAPDSLVRRADNSLVLYPGNGPGGLTSGKAVDRLRAGYDWVLSPGDLNGDRRPDLVVRTASTGQLWILPGTSTAFGTRTLLTSGLSRFDLAG